MESEAVQRGEDGQMAPSETFVNLGRPYRLGVGAICAALWVLQVFLVGPMRCLVATAGILMALYLMYLAIGERILDMLTRFLQAVADDEDEDRKDT